MTLSWRPARSACSSLYKLAVNYTLSPYSGNFTINFNSHLITVYSEQNYKFAPKNRAIRMGLMGGVGMNKGLKIQLGLALALGLSPLAHANMTFNVSTLQDGVDANPGDAICQTATNTCTLRAAVQEANRYEGGISTINLPIEGVYTLGEGIADDANPIDDRSGDLDIINGRTVIINGSSSRLMAIDGAREDRVFDVRDGAHLTLNDVTVRNGNVFVDADPNDTTIREQYELEDGGGGIKVYRGSLTLSRVAVVDNAASVGGGGIDIIWGDVEINASTIDGNSVVGFGGGLSIMNSAVDINDSAITNNVHDAQTIIFAGGIFNSSTGDGDYLNITRSTISGNSAYRDGGGIYHQMGNLKIVNTTISGNTARQWGGGLFNADTLFWTDVDLINTTITNNVSMGNVNVNTGENNLPPDPRGGGLYNRAQSDGQGGAYLRLLNSIVAGNQDDDGLDNDCFNAPSSIIDKVGTLISNASCLNLNESVPSESVPAYGTPDFDVLLYNDSGPNTHALLGTSDAIDLGDREYCPSHDQRRFERPGLSCDSGAYEFGAGEFGMPLVDVAVAFGGEQQNHRPEASDLLVDVAPGVEISVQLVAVDDDGVLDGAFGQHLPSPTKGAVTSWSSAGVFTYRSFGDSSGIDQFGFEYCDAGGLCDQGVVSVNINNVAVEPSVTARLQVNDGTLISPVTVIADADLIGTLSDADFAFPLGAMFFDVTNIPTNQSSVTVTLELPAGLDIATDAVVRKMNRFDTWMTLGNVVDPSLSTAVFTQASAGNPATVALTLVDNDIFDLDRRVGSISDPVALGVSTGPTPDPEPEPEPSPEPTPAPGGDAAAEEGGGAAGLGFLSALLLIGLWRRRADFTSH